MLKNCAGVSADIVSIMVLPGAVVEGCGPVKRYCSMARKCELWNAIFSSLGVLQYDTTIAGVVRFLGWCGMLAVVGWLVWVSLKQLEVSTQHSEKGI